MYKICFVVIFSLYSFSGPKELLKECRGGIGKKCIELSQLADKKGIKEIAVKSVIYGCLSKHKASCTKVKKYHDDNSYNKIVLNAFEKICQNKSQPDSCILSIGILNFLKNSSEAQRLSSLSCVNGHEKSCLLTSSLLLMSDKAEQAFKVINDNNLCTETSNVGCFISAEYYYKKKELEKALKAAKMSCVSKDNYRGCNIASNISMMSNKMQEMYDFAKIGCKFDDLASCHQLALASFKVKGIQQAIMIAQKNCDNDYAKSCGFLGSLYYKNKNDDLALRSFTKSCKLGEKKSCQYLK